MISFCFYISHFTVSTILELGFRNGRGKENIRERNKHIPVQWIQKFKRGRKRIKNKGRTEKGRSLSALLDLLRGNIRPETPDWLPVDTHTCTHTHVHARTHTLADTFVLSGPMGAKLLLARLLNIGVSTTETEKEDTFTFSVLNTLIQVCLSLSACISHFLLILNKQE